MRRSAPQRAMWFPTIHCDRFLRENVVRSRHQEQGALGPRDGAYSGDKPDVNTDSATHLAQGSATPRSEQRWPQAAAGRRSSRRLSPLLPSVLLRQFVERLLREILEGRN